MTAINSVFLKTRTCSLRINLSFSDFLGILTDLKINLMYLIITCKCFSVRGGRLPSSSMFLKRVN